MAATTWTTFVPEPVDALVPSFEPTDMDAWPGAPKVHVIVAPWFGWPGPLAAQPAGMPQKNWSASPSGSLPLAVKVTGWPTTALAGPVMVGGSGGLLRTPKLLSEPLSPSHPSPWRSRTGCGLRGRAYA